MKLELKHLAPYLPYKLKYANTKNKNIYTLRSLHLEINLVDFGWGDAMEIKEVKPILRPLSDLVKVIECKGKSFIPYEDSLLADSMESNNDLEYLCEFKGDVSKDTTISYLLINKLIEWHFNVFGLIEKGLAIDINTL